MADSVYESNWMRFPSHLQKHFILMIRNSRRPIEYKGYFAVFTVNLETFAKVILMWIEKIKSKVLLTDFLCLVLVNENCFHILHGTENLF